MTALGDLPSLGGGGGRFGGFGITPNVEDMDEDSNDGFDDFDLNEDAFGDSSNKFDDAEKHLKDFYQEEAEGFKIEANKGSKTKPNAAGGKAKEKKGGFKVNIHGMNHDDDFDDDIIEEDIQTDRDEQANLLNPGIAGQGPQQYGITVSGSLGIDPSVDSLAIEDFDYVEQVQP